MLTAFLAAAFMFVWSLCLVTPVAMAQNVNITVDPEKQLDVGVQAPRFAVPTDGIREFDVELRGWLNNPLTGVVTLVSGLDPINGFHGMTIGDVFIRSGHGSVAAPTRSLGELGSVSYQNGPAGYDYALRLVPTGGQGLTYQIYDLSPTSVLVSLQDPLAHGGELEPYRLDTSTADYVGSGSTLVDVLMDTQIAAATGVPDHTWSPGPYPSWYSQPNRINYLIGFDFGSFLAPETSFTVFVGQSSGRDTLTGVEMPEASTVAGGVLLFLGSAMLVLRRCYRW